MYSAKINVEGRNVERSENRTDMGNKYVPVEMHTYNNHYTIINVDGYEAIVSNSDLRLILGMVSATR